MSRSEQTQDAGMDEILASIRKIISDDDPEAPDADVLNAALDGFASAPQRAPQSYMGDLTRALIAEPAPQPSDDDIFDEAPAAPGYARRMSEALAEAIRAPQAAPAPVPAFASEAVEDDADLFEAGATSVDGPEEAEPIEALEIAIETVVEDDEDAVAELDDPIALGPEIELVDEVADIAAPNLDAIAAEPAMEAMPVAPPAVRVAPPPPPPPPAPVSVAVDDLPTPEAEVPIEAKAPVEPVAPAEPTVPESVVVAEIPATVEVEAAEPIADDEQEPAASETMPAPESDLIALAVAGTDAPSTVDDVPAESIAAAPVASAETSPVAEAAAPAVLAAATADATPAAGVSEDMMAALLKPMLKEWLDANMPRIVAKAMGEGGKPDADAPAS